MKFFESHQFGNSTRKNDQTILYIVAKNFTPENHVFQPQNVREKNDALEAFIYKASRASKKVATKNQLKITMMNDYFALLLT